MFFYLTDFFLIYFLQETETRDEVEISPQSGIIMNELAVRFEQYGGFALIADYGHDGSLTDTFRVSIFY